MRYFCSSLVALTACTLSACAADSNTTSFDWDSIEASKHLEYHTCYGKYKCARLLLPLDPLDKNNNNTVAIAITKLPAVVADDDASFGGTIILNPGGPGESGVSYIQMAGSLIRPLVDIEKKKHYELLSFDPRGVGFSVPSVNCFAGLSRYTKAVETAASGALDSSPAAFSYGLASAIADGKTCGKHNGDFLSYVATPYVARDMLGMVDEIDRLRKGAKKDTEKNSGGDMPRLQYIGYSYGTFLGNSFASMFPGRIGRMVLDGVVDSQDYLHGPGWLANTVDLDEIVDNFFQGCFTAGPDVCKLRRKTDTSAYDISHRFWAWADDLNENPLVHITSAAGEDFKLIVRTDDIRVFMITALEGAVASSQGLATLLNAAMQGNLKSLASALAPFSYQASIPTACLASNSTSTSAMPGAMLEQKNAIVCADGQDVTNQTSSYWRDYLEKQKAISSVGGAQWTTNRLPCAGWPQIKKQPVKSPFTTPKASKSAAAPEPGRPAAPLLFMSNRYDPVTPLRSARAMAKYHPGAGLLILESTGHTTLSGAPGPCVKKVMGEYFDTGAVPKGEVVCKPTTGPWDPTNSTASAAPSIQRRRFAL